MGWQKRAGYTRRALVETAISRLKRGIGDALRSRTVRRRLTEVAIAIAALNRMPEPGLASKKILLANSMLPLHSQPEG